MLARRSCSLFLEGSFHLQEGLLERRKIIFHRPPDDLAIDTLIFMPQDIADACDVFPANVLVRRLQLAAKMPAGFRDNLNSSLHRRAQNP
jgi:hypothetical protein